MGNSVVSKGMPKGRARPFGVSILVVSASPRKPSNSALLAQEALEGVLGVAGVSGKLLDCAGRTLVAGPKTKSGNLPWVEALHEQWRAADGLVVITPVFHMSAPASLRATLELGGTTPYLWRPTGVVVHGSSRFGGQETALVFTLMQLAYQGHLPVAPDTGGFFGAVGHSPTWEPGSIKQDRLVFGASRSVGRRTAELAAIIKAGGQIAGDAGGRAGAGSAARATTGPGVAATAASVSAGDPVKLTIFDWGGGAGGPSSGFSGLPVEMNTLDLRAERLYPCLECYRCRSAAGQCAMKDRFAELRGIWLESDVILYRCPDRPAGVPVYMKCFVDRLGHSTIFADTAVPTDGLMEFPRYLKVVGLEGARGSVATMEVLTHAASMGCVPLPPTASVGEAVALAATIKRGLRRLEASGGLDPAYRKALGVQAPRA